MHGTPAGRAHGAGA